MGIKEMQLQKNNVVEKYKPNRGVDEKEVSRLRKQKQNEQNALYKNQGSNNVGN